MLFFVFYFYPNELRFRYKIGHVTVPASEQLQKVSQRGARTHDPQIKSLMLYRLS